MRFNRLLIFIKIMRDSKQNENEIKSNERKKIGIVLDLDETLVFTTIIQPKKKDRLEI